MFVNQNVKQTLLFTSNAIFGQYKVSEPDHDINKELLLVEQISDHDFKYVLPDKFKEISTLHKHYFLQLMPSLDNKEYQKLTLILIKISGLLDGAVPLTSGHVLPDKFKESFLVRELSFSMLK